MKLFYRVLMHLLAGIVVVLIGWAVVFYMGIMEEINDEVDDSLEDYTEIIITRSLAGKELPANVVGVLADCGFSSPKAIIKKCAKDMHYPAELIYPFIKLGARIYGQFDLEEYSPEEAMNSCKLPVIFFHGEDLLDFVSLVGKP